MKHIKVLNFILFCSALLSIFLPSFFFFKETDYNPLHWFHNPLKDLALHLKKIGLNGDYKVIRINTKDIF